MNYKKTMEYLQAVSPSFQKVGASGYKEGLEKTLLLDAFFDHPHKKYKTIHVGGTNGKGSTSHTLAAIFQSAGYKTGLYTSPELLDFRESIRVSGAMIEEEFIIDFVEKYKEYHIKIESTFFEITTMMAFCYFQQQSVDVAIIEVGLGGRLDSTNIIQPELSIITNISFDHVQILGDTLEEIAKEKAGIIKKRSSVVIGECDEDSIKKIFLEKASQEKTSIFFAEDNNLIHSAKEHNDGWIYDTTAYGKLESVLGGLAQIKNSATILTAVELLKTKGFDIPNEAVSKGFKEVKAMTGFIGRWQTLQESPKVICDTGHNVGAFKYIVEQLNKEDKQQLHIVIGMVRDKDISSILEMLPTKANYYFTKANIPRALDEEELLENAKQFGLNGFAYSSVKKAIEAARAKQKNDDLLYIGGSSFIVAEAFAYFE